MNQVHWPAIDGSIKLILKDADFEKMSRKMIRKLLEQEYQQNFSSIKVALNDRIVELIMKHQEAVAEEDQVSEEEEEEIESSSEDEAYRVKKRKTTKANIKVKTKVAKTKKAKTKAAKAKKAKKTMTDDPEKPKTGAFHKPLMCSPDLCQILSFPDAVSSSSSSSSNSLHQLSRPQVVKQLWQYIHTHGLQDPSDKRTIVCDESLRRIFGRETVTMFSMNKYLAKHLVEPSVFASTYASLWTNVSLRFTPEEERAYDAGKRENKTKKKDPVTSAKVQAKPRGLAQPMVLSPALAAFVGAKVMARSQVVKELWMYIKAHELQNPQNKREIRCDATLECLFAGQTLVTMFSMHKFLNPHFVQPASHLEEKEEEEAI